jgi:hypothetical protein
MGQYRVRKLLVGISKNEIHVRHCNNSGHFMMRYYNAVVLCHDERRIPYRDVTSVQDFVNCAKRNLSFQTIMFCCKTHYKSKQGDYCGFYSLRSGLVPY